MGKMTMRTPLSVLFAVVAALLSDVTFVPEAHAIVSVETLAFVRICQSGFQDNHTDPFSSASSVNGSKFIQNDFFDTQNPQTNCGIVGVPQGGVTLSGFANANADLFTGTLRALASISGFDQNTPNLGTTAARAELIDTITLHAPTSIPVPVTINGTLHGATSGLFGQVSLSILRGILGSPARSHTEHHVCFGTGTGISECDAQASGLTTLADSFFIAPETPFFVDARLVADAENSGFADGFNTATLSLVLPAGVTFTSESGVFLSGTPVPADTTPPTTTATRSPTPNTNGWNKTNVVVTLNATDNSGGSGVKEIGFSLNGAQGGTGLVAGSSATVTISAEGTTTLTFFARDNAGNQEPAKTLAVRIDKTPPVISGLPAVGCKIWPPNHSLVEVATVTAADALSGLAPASPTVTGTSNESSLQPGSGQAPTDVVVNGTSVQLRAERSGSGNGRVYTLTASASDLAGNSTTAIATCTVPHDQGK